MKVERKVVTAVGSLIFGYWDADAEEFIPVDIAQSDSLKQAVKALSCSEELVDALGTFASLIAELVAEDLLDIWRRLDAIERI